MDEPSSSSSTLSEGVRESVTPVDGVRESVTPVDGVRESVTPVEVIHDPSPSSPAPSRILQGVLDEGMDEMVLPPEVSVCVATRQDAEDSVVICRTLDLA